MPAANAGKKIRKPPMLSRGLPTYHTASTNMAGTQPQANDNFATPAKLHLRRR